MSKGSHKQKQLFYEKGVRKSLEKIYWKKRVSKFILIKNPACIFIKENTLTQVFPCEFCEIFKSTFFTEHLRATASAEYF